MFDCAAVADAFDTMFADQGPHCEETLDPALNPNDPMYDDCPPVDTPSYLFKPTPMTPEMKEWLASGYPGHPDTPELRARALRSVM